MADLVRKILLAIEIGSPSLSWEDVSLFPRELEKLLALGILTQRQAFHANCKECHAPCEIQKLTNDDVVIYCEECEYPRIAKISKDQTHEYRINIRTLLVTLLTDLGYKEKEILESVPGKLWSIGTHDINESPRLFLFVTNDQGKDENLHSYLKQNQHLKPILFSSIVQFATQITSIPLDSLLTKKGKLIFNKHLFRAMVGDKGIVASTSGIYLGENKAICIEKNKILFNLNSLGAYENTEEITGTASNMIAFLVKISGINKNTWKSRTDLAESFHCKEETISNIMSRIRSISDQIGINIIDQHERSKKYRINPDLITESSSLASSPKNRF